MLSKASGKMTSSMKSRLLTDEFDGSRQKVAEYYFAPLISVLQAMLPPSLSRGFPRSMGRKSPTRKWVEIVDPKEDDLTPKQVEMLRLIAKNSPILKKEAGSAAILEKLLRRKMRSGDPQRKSPLRYSAGRKEKSRMR
jgi:primosomal protein N'